FRAGSRSIAAAWAKARELERTRAEERRQEAEPHIALPADDEATILGGDPLADSGEHAAVVEPSPAAPVVRVASSREAFPDQGPLIVAEPAAPPKRSRRKKS